jgi:hypothetical protein
MPGGLFLVRPAWAHGWRLEGFDRGKPALNDWLLRQARQAHGSGSAKTFVVTDDDRVVGYFSLTVGQVDTLQAPERIRKGMGQYPVPVVILARLAAGSSDRAAQAANVASTSRCAIRSVGSGVR